VGIGVITVDTTGAITAPSSLSPAVSAALTTVYSGIGGGSAILFPSLKAVAVCNGVDFQYHYRDAAQYTTGPLAPYTAPTVASTAVRATRVLTFTDAVAPYTAAAANPSNGDIIQIGAPGQVFNGAITFKATLDPTLYQDQVLIGADVDATISNLTKFLNNTGTQGSEYFSARAANGLIPTGTTGWADYNGIEVSTSTAFNTGTGIATITFRAIAAGTVGNTYLSVVVIGATMTFPGANFTGGTAGSGTAPAAGTYQYAYAYQRSGDFAGTAVSNKTTLEVLTNANVTVSAYDTPPTRDAMTSYRIFRTTTDGSQLFQDVDTVSSPATDDQTDAEIQGDFREVYDETITRPYGAGYPTRYRAHAMFKGSVFGVGAVIAAEQTQGTATVVADSRTVTMSSLYCTTRLIGRTFSITSSEATKQDKYVIVDASESAGTITLNRPYEGAGATTTYSILDDRNPYAVYYCEPELLNNWPATYSIEGIVGKDGVGCTAIRAFSDRLVVWTRTGTWLILGSIDSGFRFVPLGQGNGCWGPDAVIEAGGVLLWWGPDGIFWWAGAGEPQELSNPDWDGQDVPLGILATVSAVNAEAAAGIVSAYNPTTNKVMWWAPVDGSLWNNKVVVLNMQTKGFSFASCDAVTAAAVIPGPNGTSITITGDAYARLWQQDHGYSDGAYGFETVHALTGYTASTGVMTVTGTPFPTSSGGLVGVPVYTISATTGALQRRTVVANTSSTLTPDSPFDTAPAVSDQIVVGGIPFRVQTSKFSLDAPEVRKTVSSMTVQFEPTTDGQLWCAAGINENDPSVHINQTGVADYADLTDAKGRKVFEMRKGAGQTIQMELFAIAPGFDLSVIGYVPTIRVRQEVPR
jgi:hypothetical protein